MKMRETKDVGQGDELCILNRKPLLRGRMTALVVVGRFGLLAGIAAGPVVGLLVVQQPIEEEALVPSHLQQAMLCSQQLFL